MILLNKTCMHSFTALHFISMEVVHGHIKVKITVDVAKVTKRIELSKLLSQSKTMM